MKRVLTIKHQFVEHAPEQLDEGVLYISVEYGTCLHRCLCGCGAEVVTPLSPRAWSLSYDGETVSLSPSIGSWSLRCQSHYVIQRSRVRWMRAFTSAEIDTLRRRERALAAGDKRGVPPSGKRTWLRWPPSRR